METGCKNRHSGGCLNGCWLTVTQINQLVVSEVSPVPHTELHSSLLRPCQYAFEHLWRWKWDDTRLYLTLIFDGTFPKPCITASGSSVSHKSQHCTSDHECYRLFPTVFPPEQSQTQKRLYWSNVKHHIWSYQHRNMSKSYLIWQTHYLFNCESPHLCIKHCNRV